MVRWWSTRPRAAAPRTPGWWRTEHAFENCLRSVLDVALPGARREPRAHARRQLLAVADAAGRPRRRPRRTGPAAADHRHPGRIPEPPRPAACRAHAAFLRPRCGEPGEHLLLPASRAQQRPRRARAD